MIQDNDNIVLGKIDKVIWEHSLADVLYDFMNSGGFEWSNKLEDRVTDGTELLFYIERDGEDYVTKVNEKIVNRINVLAKRLPKPLYVSYSYTVYDIQSGTRKVPVRSGFNITIQSPSVVEYKFWDGAIIPEQEFKVELKLLCERSTDEVHYQDRLALRFTHLNESSTRVAYLLDHKIYTEKGKS